MFYNYETNYHQMFKISMNDFSLHNYHQVIHR